MNNEQFIQKVKEAHGNSLNFDKTVFNGNFNDKVVVICPIHGDFLITAKHLLYSKQGCKQCKIDKQKLTQEECLNRIKNIHGDKYDLSKVKYINSRTPITLICQEHGEFQITPNSIFHQHAGCQKCGYKSMQSKNAKILEEFITEASAIHDNSYDYSNIIYVNNKTPIEITCKKCGHTFKVRPDNHLKLRSGCPKCKQSKLELDIEHLLSINNLTFTFEQMFDWLRCNNSRLSLDFYLPNYNIAIECQGEQHFSPVDFANRGKEWAIKEFNKIQIRDREKLRLCEEHGIKILYYSNLTQYDNFLGNKLYHSTEEILETIKGIKLEKEIVLRKELFGEEIFINELE